jgi:hypothetical protein
LNPLVNADIIPSPISIKYYTPQRIDDKDNKAEKVKVAKYKRN